MALNAKKVPTNNGAPRVEQEPLDPGTYPARVVQIIDLGVQAQRPYKGGEKAPAHEIMMTYEFLDEFCKNEEGEDDETKPRWLSETFPFLSLESDLAKSTKRYRALDPDEDHDGDFTKLIETPCVVTVVNNESNGKVYNNIHGVSTMRPKEAAKAEGLKNPPKVFVLDDPDMEVFLSLPTWLQDKIKGNLRFEGSPLQTALEGHEKGPTDKPKATPKPAAKKRVEELEEASEGNVEEDVPW